MPQKTLKTKKYTCTSTFRRGWWNLERDVWVGGVNDFFLGFTWAGSQLARRAQGTYRQAVPDGQGQRSIQVEGFRVACELRQAPHDQYGLTSRSQRFARAYPT